MAFDIFNYKINLTPDIKFILETLQKNGQGYIVGGYIRDLLLGVEPKDCDFVTDIEYDKLLEIFSLFSPKEIGKHFGVVQIKLNGITYEIAKMRQGKGIPKNRKEQEVKFTNDIYKDLKRRDFNINAVAYDGKNIFSYDDLIFLNDYTENKINFVGNAEERIKEDPLRILRFFRFIATKGLFCNKETCEIIKSNKNLLNNISKERIREELNKILLSKYASLTINLMQEYDILQEIIPEWSEVIDFNQRNKHHCFTLDIHILRAVECVEPDLITRLALLFHDIGKPKCFTIGEDKQGHFYGHEKISADMAEIILKRLKYDNNTIERVVKLIRYHLFYKSSIDKPYAKKLLNRFGEEDIYRFFRVIEADRIAHNPPYDFESIDKLKLLIDEILRNKLPISLKDLDINGKDIMKELKLNQGPYIGEILDFLLHAVIKNDKLNNKDDLLRLAKEYWGK